MAKLPYSRTVNVTLTRNQQFPTRRGFGVLMLLTNVAVAGILDATNRTKVYGTIEEVQVDHATSTDVYKAALTAFSQNPRPLQIKVGFATFNVTTGTGAELQTQLSAINDYDSDWYWLTVTAPFRDLAALDELADWVEAQPKQALIDSNDVATENAAVTTSFAGRNKGQFERTSVFYHTDEEEYLAVATAARLGTFNFDQADSNYTAKFKKLNGVAPVDIGSAAVQAVTGFTPALGQSLTAGHMANTYVDIGGQFFLVEGSTLTPNVFIDEVHASDWIIARTEEETLGVLLNNNAVPFTDAGMELLASGARTVMRQAFRAGLVADDINPTTGNYEAAVEFNIPSVFDVPESQRKARIAPEIAVRFRYRGAVHYTTINYRMTF